MLQTRSLIRRSVDQWESERKTSAWKLLKQKSNFHNNRIPSKWSDFRQIICHIFFREISVILPLFDWLLSFSSATDCFWSEIGRGPILIISIHWRYRASRKYKAQILCWEIIKMDQLQFNTIILWISNLSWCIVLLQNTPDILQRQDALQFKNDEI